MFLTPKEEYDCELHHARMTLLPFIAEGGQSLYTAMMAVRALWRVEFLVKRLRKEGAENVGLGDGKGCEERAPSDGETK